MDRKEKVIRYINPNGFGIEIGPSYEPIAPKRDGYKVQIIDHMDRAQLIEKYRAWHVTPEKLANIEDVDFVWQGGDYSTLTGKNKYYDWIIAAHMIEHTPDLIGFLNDCDSILKNDGVISLVIPDKRYCFDHFRPITGISKIIDSHISRNEIPSPGTVAEFYLSRVSKSGNIAWDSNTVGEYLLLHPPQEAIQKMQAVMTDKKYIDTHVWCFVPHSFRLLIHDLFELGFIPFREAGFYPTEGCEFFITLSRNGKGIDTSRLELLKMSELELGENPLIPEAPQVHKPKRKIWQRLIGRSA